MSCPLEGLKVYVDVRSSDGKANYSSCVRQQLELLGADIHNTISNTCTHVVFKDGKMNTRIHANKLGLTLVNVLWVERCRETNSKCDESRFPVTDDRVETPVHLRKARTRYRSLQPAADLDAVRGSSSRSSKPRAIKPEARRRSGRKSGAVTEAPSEGAPLKPKERLNRKLQWPPDHSDVCSEAELAAHVEISQDLKKNRKNGKRKLKKSGIFDTAASNSQNTKSVGSTDLFVVTKTPAPKEPNISEKEDSQFSLYDASQHFERKDYSVTNIISKLDTTIEKAPVDGFDDLYSDSEPEFLSSPSKSKRTCELTNSQKNVMDRTFEFDEVDRNAKPKKPRKSRNQGASKVERQKLLLILPQKAEDPISVLNSPTKMLTFNSNYKDNSDIVTDLDVDIGETDEIVALQQIKSPTVISRKRSKPRMSAAAKKIDVGVTKKKLTEVDMNRRGVSSGPKNSNLARNLLKNLDKEDTKASFESNVQQENVKLLLQTSEKDSSPKHTTAKDLHPSKQSGKTEIAKVLQEPEVSSTSEAKENGADNKQRRTSKRIRHSSSKLTNPDFVYQAARGTVGGTVGYQAPRDKSLTYKSSEPAIVEETPAEFSVPEGKVDELTEESVSITRKSHRKRRTNPKYLSDLSDSSAQTSGISDLKPDKILSPQKYTKTPEGDTSEKGDLSISEYSTTETPILKKPVRVCKRESKCTSTVIMTTTDTEDSTSETLNRRPSSKRKKTKKAPDIAALPKRKVASDNSPRKVICTTCCHRDDQAMVRTTVKMLSGAVSEFVAKETTHVVMGTPKRTINLLKAVIHGAYVLSLDWVTDSISEDSWQKESKYQLTTEFPILKVKGEGRRATAASLFADIGLIFVEKDTSPPQSDLVELVELCGGKVTRSRTRSRYCIGGAAQDKEHISLSEQWVLDSITKLRLQDSNKYLLFPYRSPSPEF